MSDRKHNLERKIRTAYGLKSLTKTLKILAAINIGGYERAVASLQGYYHSIELGLIVCLKQSPDFLRALKNERKDTKRIGLVVFGSDQGMVGQFNDLIVEFAQKEISSFSAEKIVWPIGERVYLRMREENLLLMAPLDVPKSIHDILPLISEVLDKVEKEREERGLDQLLVFHNQPALGATFTPTWQNLLPVDLDWLSYFYEKKWPNKVLPELVDGIETAFPTLIQEHLFASLYKACAESLNSENASRLQTMQVAEKHIDELLNTWQREFYRERQNTIDEELFDVVSGFETAKS